MPEEITMGPILRKPPTTTDDVRAIVNGSYSGDPHEVIKHMASTLAKELSPLRKSGRTDDLLHVIVRQLEAWLVNEKAPVGDKPPALPVALWLSLIHI